MTRFSQIETHHQGQRVDQARNPPGDPGAETCFFAPSCQYNQNPEQMQTRMTGAMTPFQSVCRQIIVALLAAVFAPTLLMAGASPSAAEDVYPDIVGTWTGEGLDVRLPSDGSGAIFSSETVTQVVTEQRDRRFTGTMHSASSASEQFSIAFVGVFLDREHFRWSEPNGFVEGRMIDEDTIESCYVPTAPDGQNAACQTLKRGK